VAAQGLIRDSEIEITIRAFATPLFNAAGVDADSVRVYIINDRALNSFVAGGQNIFVTTGLLMRAEKPSQVIGVLAHETGHISGGHLARMGDELRNATNEALAATILGLLIGVGTGQGGAGMAAGAAGMHVAERSFLKYSRTQEQSADQAALKFLDQTHQSARGLMEFFNIIGDQELVAPSRQDPYVQTHPLTRDRMDFVRNHVEHSPYANAPENPSYVDMFNRARAKLVGFIESLDRTLKVYPESDQSLAARYARAIAYYRVSRLDRALPLTDALIAQEPKNPFFRELKGQMLFENARVREALEPYQESVRLAPNEPLLRTGLAHVQLELDDPTMIKPALSNLNAALQVDDTNAQSWQLAAVAYGRDNQLGMAALSLAEYNLLVGRRPDARGQAARAERLLPRGSPGWLRAQDIQVQTKNERDRERNR